MHAASFLFVVGRALYPPLFGDGWMGIGCHPFTISDGYGYLGIHPFAGSEIRVSGVGIGYLSAFGI